MKSIFALLLSSAILGTACSASEPIQPARPAVDQDVQGSWGPNNTGAVVPGNSFLLSLVDSTGTITGSGSFAGEAGPFGALAVTGAISSGSVDLRIVYVYEPHVFPQLQPDTAEFVGRLTSKDQIDGSLTRRGVTSPLGLVRLRVGDVH